MDRDEALGRMVETYMKIYLDYIPKGFSQSPESSHAQLARANAIATCAMLIGIAEEFGEVQGGENG